MASIPSSYLYPRNGPFRRYSLGSRNQESKRHWVQALTCASCSMQPQSAICPFWAQKPCFVKLGPSSSVFGGSVHPTCHHMSLWPRDSQHLDQARWSHFSMLKTSVTQRWASRLQSGRFWPTLCCQVKGNVQVGQDRWDETARPAGRNHSVPWA